MRKIKLNNGSYVEVNEKVHFLEGLALVDGKVLITNSAGIASSGVINENYEEAFTNEEDLASKSLMFYRANKCCNVKMQRFGARDFFVAARNRSEEWYMGNEYRHIRVVDGVPTILSKLPVWPKETNKESVVLVGNQFYDVLKGKYSTHEFQEVSLLDRENGVYYIQDKLALESAEDDKDLFVDYWNFQMDVDLQLLSYVWSSRGEDVLQDGLTYNEYLQFRNERLDELGKAKQSYNKRVLALKQKK